jgi:uncharacterized protein (TIGR02231 family)
MSLPLPSGRAVLAPVTQVTLLEDRAQVVRSGTVSLEPGTHKVHVLDVSPILQNVSLRAHAQDGAKVVDARVVRTWRVTKEEKPEQAKALETRIEGLSKEHRRLAEDLAVSHERLERLNGILQQGIAEVPQDAAWGQVQQVTWRETFEQLFGRARALRAKVLEQQHAAQGIRLELEGLVTQRQAMDRPDTRFVAWLEAEVVVTKGGSVSLSFEYTVPNALWRPLHQAELARGRVKWTCSAAVWQNTGEDWKEAQLFFSTARSSLGTEPPRLSDDLLAAKKKAEQVVVQVREVAVQKAGVTGAEGGEPPSSVELPGVDDGGEVRTLKAPTKHSVTSDGRPNLVPLFGFDEKAEVKRVTMPELAETVFVKATFVNGAPFPILAGPVELFRDAGVVGWSKTLFAAPKEPMALSFGPDDALRVVRSTRDSSETNAVTKWTTGTTRVSLYFSNIGDAARQVELTERIPVSEIEHVTVTLLDTKGQPKPTVDADGMCTWKVELAGNAQTTLAFGFSVSRAPGVQLG